MKSAFLCAASLCATFALAGCLGSTSGTIPTVVDPLIGKRLVAGEDTVFIIKADGTMGGTLRGDPIVGTYSANTQETCSTYTAPAQLVGREFCSIPVITGDTVVFQRRDGTTSPVYEIRG